MLQKYNQYKKEHPLRGCFLPPMEEQMMLGVDVGYHENEKEDRYMPQLLSDLYGSDFQGNYRWFWSSSVVPNDAGYALYLSGGFGEVGYYYRNYGRSVRCSCVGAAW